MAAALALIAVCVVATLSLPLAAPSMSHLAASIYPKALLGGSGNAPHPSWYTSSIGFEYIANTRLVVYDYNSCKDGSAAAAAGTCMLSSPVFREFTLPTLLPLAFDYIPGTSSCLGCGLNEWLRARATDPSFRYAVVLATGSYVSDIAAFKAEVLKLVRDMEASGAIVAGHIINMRAERDDDSAPFLHEQFFVIDKAAWWERLGGVHVGGPFSKNFLFPGYAASKDVFHDRYTPLWLDPVARPRANATRSAESLGTALLASCLEQGVRVLNVPAPLRATKGFIYPAGVVPKFVEKARAVVASRPHALQALAKSKLGAAELAATGWALAYTPVERWITVRTQPASPCFEVSCGATRAKSTWVYVATNERPITHTQMRQALDTASTALQLYSEAGSRGYITVVGGFQGVLHLLDAVSPSTELTFIDFGKEQVFMGRAWMELLLVSTSLNNFVSRVFGRDLDAFLASTGEDTITEVSQLVYLAQHVDAALQEDTRAKLSTASRLTFDRYFLPLQTAPLLAAAAAIGDPQRAGGSRQMTLFGPLRPGDYTINYGTGILASEAAFQAALAKARGLRISFADVDLNYPRTLAALPASFASSVTLHLSNADDAKYPYITSLRNIETSLAAVAARNGGTATMLSTNKVRVFGNLQAVAAAAQGATKDACGPSACRFPVSEPAGLRND